MRKLLVLFPILLACCACTKISEHNIQAKILSVNTNIVEGSLKGGLLSSPSGNYSENEILLGISFDKPKDIRWIHADKILMDIKVDHAVLAEYKDSMYVPIRIVIHSQDVNSYAKIYVHGKKAGVLEEQ
jgi:hypothetical protein